jgi:hypothetical protein
VEGAFKAFFVLYFLRNMCIGICGGKSNEENGRRIASMPILDN